MAAPNVTYTFSNSTTADATEVNQNFIDIINGITDGTKDLTINLLTVNGAASFNGNVTLGNATGDDVTVTGRVASDVIPKTADTYDLGNATLTWRAMYLDNDTTDGGALYFDGGSTKFIKASADGTNLDIGGFTGITGEDLTSVGIGTSSPGSPLEIFSDQSYSNANGLLHLHSDDIPNITMQSDEVTSGYSNWQVAGNVTAGGTLEFRNSSTLANGSTAAGDADTTRVTINNSGFLGIGTTSPGEELDVNGDAKFGGRGFYIKSNDGSNILNGSTLSVTTTGAAGPGATGIVIVSCHRSSGAQNLTGGSYFFASRGARGLATLATQTLGSTAAFTITIDATNTVVVTNTSTVTCNITMTVLYCLTY